MTLALHTIKVSAGVNKKRKRVGRGNSSGRGTYSTRGLKGQKSRSGVSNLKRLGYKKIMLQAPKLKGFKSNKPKNQVLNLSDLNKVFKDGSLINPSTLKEQDLINKKSLPVKILGNGNLKLKKLIFENIKLSASAEEKIKKLAGIIK